MKSLAYTVLFFTMLGWTVPARATSITIVPTFDSSITSDVNASAIETTINNVIATYESLFTNPITVDIYFQEGAAIGDNTGGIVNASYTQFYKGLVANNANPAAIAALQANGGNPTSSGPGATSSGDNPVTGTSTIELRTAESRAIDPTGSLGIGVGPGCQVTTAAGDKSCGGTGAAVDAIVTFNATVTDPPQGNANGNYSLVAILEHEIDEVLGLGSALENISSTTGSVDALNDTPFNAPQPEDLFRWSLPTGGVRTLSADCTSPSLAYFSYGPSTGEIAQFNNSCNNGDFGDWSGDTPVQVQDAVSTANTFPVLGPSEFAALTAIGYDLAAPEPALFFPVGCMLALALVVSSRRRAFPRRPPPNSQMRQ